jgi:MEMO1 family protein
MRIRKPLAHDIFYPSDPGELTALVTASLGNPSGSASLPAALVVPHAAYSETAALLGSAYGALSGCSPHYVLILSPLHSEVLEEDRGRSLFYPDFAAFALPGGEVQTDAAALARIASALPDDAAPGGWYFDEEPGIELQLPFVREVFRGKAVVPLFTGSRCARTAGKIAAAIRLFPPEKTVVIISSNLTGYLPKETADRQAEAMLQLLEQRQPQRLLEAAASRTVSMCGTAAVEALNKSRWFPPENGWQVLGHSRREIERMAVHFCAALRQQQTD